MERMKAKMPKFNDPVAAIEEYDSTHHHKYLYDYNPFRMWSGIPEPHQ